MIQLRDYQQSLIQAITDTFREKKHKHIAAYLSQGGGKSLVAAYMAINSVKKGNKVLILTHRQKILEQNLSKIERSSITTAVVNCNTKSIPKADCYVGMVQTVTARIKEKQEWVDWLKSFTFVIIDELHRAEHDYVMSQLNPNIYWVGLSATINRSGNGTKQLGTFYDCIVKTSEAKDLIKKGFLLPSKNYVMQAPKLDNIAIERHSGDYNIKQLQNKFQKAERYAGVVKEYQRLTPNTKAIVFTTGVQHCAELCAEFNAEGVKAKYIVSGKVPEYDELYSGNHSKLLKQYHNGEFNVLVNVFTLDTGFDAPDIETVILDMSTTSYSRYAQCIDSKTEILCKSGWKTINTISHYDIVASYNINSDLMEWSNILNIYKRPINKDEHMYGLSSNYMDVRVTGGHNMFLRKRKDNKYFFEKAMNVSHCNYLCYKTCVDVKSDGVGLSKEMLRFIGLFLSDGTMNNNSISISQSYKNKVLPLVRKIIEDTGFHCNVRYVERNRTNFKEGKCDMFYFEIPRLHDRNGNGIGWGVLRDYIDKSMINFDKFNRNELKEIMYGFWIGNGNKTEIIDWNPKTFYATVSNKKIADRFQQILSVNGIKCSIHKEKSKAYKIGYSFDRLEKTFMTKKQSDNRDYWRKLEHKDNEMVWCVENKNMTIITRRNGKVCVMGNCAGRGSRPHPSLNHFNVLDFGDNISRFGALERENPPMSLWHNTSSGGVIATKECPQSLHLIPVSAKICPYCGYVFPTGRSIYEAELTELISSKSEDSMSVDKWIASKVLQGWSNNRILATICAKNSDNPKKAYMEAIKYLRTKEGKPINPQCWKFFKENILEKKKRERMSQIQK